MPILRRYAAFPAVVILPALALFCGGGQNNPAAAEENGILEIRARVVSKALAKSGAASETVANRLVVEVAADDMEAMKFELKLDLTRPSVGDTVHGIPPGKNRRVKIWAIDKNNVVTHIDSMENRRTVNIEKTVVTPVWATLIPAAGSIYLQFAGLGTEFSHVQATFTALDNAALIAENSVKREAKMFISLDNIPHETNGILRIAIVKANGDTAHIATDTLKFNARANNTIDLEFKPYNGMIKAEVGMYTPGVAIGTYDFKSKEADIVETGELIITEIMWNASNDNYIELYNPRTEAVFFETLTTDIDGTPREFDSVTIAPKGYLVIGRQNLPYVDIYTPTTGGLPITSTGNWITVKRKNGSVIDRVICAGNKSATGWPPVSGKRSIELARDKYSATDNNYGKNWSAASEFINEESPYYGSPGR